MHPWHRKSKRELDININENSKLGLRFCVGVESRAVQMWGKPLPGTFLLSGWKWSGKNRSVDLILRHMDTATQACTFQRSTPCFMSTSGPQKSYGEDSVPGAQVSGLLRTLVPRASEMAQWVRAPDCSSEGLEFKTQQPHGGSQPSITRSDTLFWCVWSTATVYLHIINKSLRKKKCFSKRTTPQTFKRHGCFWKTQLCFLHSTSEIWSRWVFVALYLQLKQRAPHGCQSHQHTGLWDRNSWD